MHWFGGLGSSAKFDDSQPVAEGLREIEKSSGTSPAENWSVVFARGKFGGYQGQTFGGRGF